MFRNRSAGILLHPSSLPGPHAIGTLGPDALRFVDFLAMCGVSVWQVLPLGPTGYGDSPYQGYSAFAGNPLLIDTPPGADAPASTTTIDYARMIGPRREAVAQYASKQVRDEGFRAFAEEQASWLADYALFAALKDKHKGAAWYTWPAPFARREATAMEEARRDLAPRIEQLCMEQYVFATQFNTVRRAARERGIRLMGDLPIYVAHDSADVWANQELFAIKEDGTLTVQAGVPPDYFSPTGQLWGNPIYLWDRMRKNGFAWWIERMRHALQRFDLVRVDHFRGFESYWEVDGDAVTAVDGRWATGPGDALFNALSSELGVLPVVAENLGLITPEVEQLRERCGFPGMAVLQFAFGPGDEGREHRPHSLIPQSVIYTGTHDNDTAVGWWDSLPPSPTKSSGPGDGEHAPSSDSVPGGAPHDVRSHALAYLPSDGTEIHWDLIRCALASVSDLALVPLQDVLGLGSESRMNLPGREQGNWAFRFSWEHAPNAVAERFAVLVDVYDRRPRAQPSPTDSTASESA